MASFYETSTLDLDLSRKTLEELLELQKELKEKTRFITTERIKAVKIVRDIEKDVKKTDDMLKLILKQIQRNEDIDEAKNTISEYIKNIEGIELLNGDELLLITHKMDRTDYRNYGDYPRWIDLEKICKEVIGMKKRYPNWILMDLEKSRQTNTMPPQCYYYYKFKDEFASYLIIEIN
jgi:hypothetical protein